jgi:hypothetical protein
MKIENASSVIDKRETGGHASMCSEVSCVTPKIKHGHMGSFRYDDWAQALTLESVDLDQPHSSFSFLGESQAHRAPCVKLMELWEEGKKCLPPSIPINFIRPLFYGL